jgi:hypothetical protein
MNLEYLMEEYKSSETNLNRFDYGIALLTKYAKMAKRKLIKKSEYNKYRNYIEKEFLDI